MATTLTGKQLALTVREEDLQELEDLLRDLQGRADKARADGRIFMMEQYVLLIARVSPEVDRIQRRFKRESLAGFRKDHKDLKAQAKAAAGTSDEA